MFNKTHGEKCWSDLFKNAMKCFQEHLEVTPKKTAAVLSFNSHPYEKTPAEIATILWATLSYGYPHMNAPVLADH